MTRKRVLFISNLYPNPSALNMAAFNRQQIDALGEWCDIDVIAPVPWQERLNKRKNIPFRRTHRWGEVFHPTYYYLPGILRALYGLFFYWSIRKDACSLLSARHYDLIFASWLFPDSWAAARLAARFRLPLYVKVHGTDVNRLQPGTATTRKSIAVSHQAEKIICVSRALKKKLAELGVPEKRLEVLYNGVDSAVFSPLNKEEVFRVVGVAPDEFVVLFVGNLKKEKGISELILAFKAVSEQLYRRARLVVVGSGGFGSVAKELVSSLGLSHRVEFLGNQPLETISLWMNAASVLCLPSYMEGVPNVVLEALACRTRVVATNVGGIPELYRAGGNITLVEPGCVEGLTQALLHVSRSESPSHSSGFLCSWQENADRLFRLFNSKSEQADKERR